MRELQRPGCTVATPVVLLALVAVAIAILVSLFDGSFVQNDSAQYVSTAENLRAGHGVATSLVWTEEHLRLGSLPVAQTNVPPGYPMLIALVSLLGVDSLWAGFLVSLACFSAIPFLIYRISRTTGRPPTVCLAVSGAWLIFPVVSVNVLGCLSEMSYTLFTLLSLTAIGESERVGANRNVWLLLAGVCAGLAFMVRYAGIICIASVGALFLIRVAYR